MMMTKKGRSTDFSRNWQRFIKACSCVVVRCLTADMGCNSSKAGGGVNDTVNSVGVLERNDVDLVRVTADSPKGAAGDNSTECPKCTFINSSQSLNCEMCNTSLGFAKSSQPPSKREEILSSPSDFSETTTTDNNVDISDSVVRTMADSPSLSSSAPKLDPDIDAVNSPSTVSKNASNGDPVAIDAFDVHLDVDEEIFARQSFEGVEGFSNFDGFEESARSTKVKVDPFAALDSTLASNDIQLDGITVLETEIVKNEVLNNVDEDKTEIETTQEKEENINETIKTKELEESENRIASAIAYAKNSFEVERQRLEKLKLDEQNLTSHTKGEESADEDITIGKEGMPAMADTVEDVKEAEEALVLQSIEENGQSMQGGDNERNNAEGGMIQEIETIDNVSEETPSVRMESYESETASSPLNVFRLTEQAWFSIADNIKVYAVLEMSNSKFSYYETDEKNVLLGSCQISASSELQKEDVHGGIDDYNLRVIGCINDRGGKEEVVLSTTDETLRNHWYDAMSALIQGNFSEKANLIASTDETENQEEVVVELSCQVEVVVESVEGPSDEIGDVPGNEPGDVSNNEPDNEPGEGASDEIAASPSRNDDSPKKKKKNKKKTKN